MSQRKLQQDIDKLLKKVKEGLQDFEDVYDKFQNTDASNTSYREKLESDLKREIKKLQKHRDQIKTWLSKEDVKEKQQVLMENRRLIESGMERFKSVEKLMKTKQFSTEALTNPDIIKDPRELKKRDQFLFVQDCLEELQKQLESFEAQEDEHQCERHVFHITNLENILKQLQNNELEPDTVEEYQEDIQYYVENNDDPDFIEYDTIYEDIGCEIQPGEESKDVDTPSKAARPAKAERSPKKRDSSVEIAPMSSSSSAAEKDKSRSLTASPNVSFSNLAFSPGKKDALQQSQLADRSATPIQNQTTQSQMQTPNQAQTPNPAQLPNPTQTQNHTQAQPQTQNRSQAQTATVEAPKDISKQIEELLAQDRAQNAAFQNPLFHPGLDHWLQTKRTLLQPHETMPAEMASQLESSLLNCPDSLDADTPHLHHNTLSLPHPTSIFFPNETTRLVSNDPVDQTRIHPKHNDIYSRTSLGRIMSKFDLDALFFIFYHYQGSYEQFLAARELTIRGWQFNKINRCWFYKEVEKLPPGMEQSEEISWRYFDYQKSWLARRCGAEFVYREEEFERI
ncbi:LANO_0G11188g1_1 [Lachancea nothofagi CBS 11611]|uniref:General negative regulator of transcription subunit n=1 Tax=Lachancea nothofagi CBS 11611 TaxID=1266666 RepID=A0A1G4KJD3_9SACH|nr:LANO_0G11188g1_1 [Lachancea nothofagi CBS 11611]